MNIINILTLRQLKLNKKRTIVTIIGVILSVSMLSAVPTFVTSFLDMMQKAVKEDTGDWHVMYKDVAIQNLEQIEKDENTESTAIGKDVGYALLEGSKNENKPYLFIKSYNEQGFVNYNLKLTQGRFPKRPNEIIISSHIKENGGVIYKIGDVLKLNIGERFIDEGQGKHTLDQESGFKEASDNNKAESLITNFSKEYIITGIVERPNFEPYWAPGYTVITYLDEKELNPDDVVNVSVSWKNINKKANRNANDLSEKLGVSGNNTIYNRELLRFYGIIGEDILTTLYLLAAIVIILIIIGSVALIYNSFAISISERSRHLGMLASVGATKKQKSRSVFFEGFIIGIIGIPLGIFFGTLGMGITFALLQPFIDGMFREGNKLSLVTSWGTILTAGLFSMITIFVSAYIPAKRASRISPIDAIRQSQDIKLTGKAVKTSKLTRFIFGFEAELGLKNLKRNSRRYKATIFSLVISIVLFLSVSSLSLLSQRSADIAIDKVPYDVKVFVTSSATAQEKKDFYTAIAKMKYVDKYVVEQTMSFMLDAESSIIPDKIKNIIEPNKNPNGAYNIYLEMKSIDEVALNRYANEVGVDVNRLKDINNPCGILVNIINLQIDNVFTQTNHLNVKVGEELELAYAKTSKSTETSNETSNEISKDSSNDSVMKFAIEIAALADKTPVGETNLTNPYRTILIVSEELFHAMQIKLQNANYNSGSQMFINTSNPSKLVDSINEYQKQTSIASLHIYDVASANKSNRQLDTFIFVFFYGFVALITAICIANIFNTISTSISLRKQEFAMLKSVGMTPEGFNKMINFESLFYGIKALIYGLPISFGMMYLIYKVISSSFGFNFIIPWASVVITVISVFGIVGLTMIYSSSKIKKENIIETLKNENI